MILFFLKGFILGFSIAAPVGPIGVLCIRRTLAYGKLAGLLSGLGAATADGIYGLVAGFGLNFISSFLLQEQSLLKFIGGLFLLYLGFSTLRSVPAEKPANARAKGLLSAYLSTLGLTITNPLTILSFLAIFAGLGIGNNTHGYFLSLLLVVGVFCGSATWWLLLSSGVSLFRTKFTLQALRWVNIFSGLIVILFGLFALGSMIR